MKTLKFEHSTAELIKNGQKTSTWRLFDDKDLSVNDAIKILDKVDAKNPESWQVIGQGSITQIIEKKLGSVSSDDIENHEPFSSKEKMIKRYKSYYGDRVDLDTPVKIISFDFSPRVGEEPSAAMLLDEAKIYTDGGSRGNPGKSAAAFVICNLDDSVVEKSGYYIGVATNNQAEYLGFKKGLERARDLGISRVDLFSDSQLVVNQMKGLYKVKNQELAPLHADVKEIAESFAKVTFTYIPREMNRIADGEVNRILDNQENS